MKTEQEGTQNQKLEISRRGALSALGAVTLMTFWSCRAGERGKGAHSDQAQDDIILDLEPSYISVNSNNSVSIVCPAAEMGQGVMTLLPALIAEEMDLDWGKVETRHSQANEAYINPMKNLQATGRSMSVRGYYTMLRRIGAQARMKLVTAAADRWGVSVGECATEKGYVLHGSTGRRLSYYDVALDASFVELTEEPNLKSKKDYRILGKPIMRKDLLEKVNGQAVFGLDCEMENLHVATIEMSPTLGGVLESYDKESALSVDGVTHVIPTFSGEFAGLGVVAKTYWQARKGLEAAAPIFSVGDFEGVDSQRMSETLRENIQNSGRLSRELGDSKGALKLSKRVVSGQFEVPYLAHAPMEPMTCTAKVTKDKCRLLAPTQGPIRVRDAAAKLLGIPQSSVSVERCYLGGSFGRRWQVDFAMQAVELSKVSGVPVKLIWSRETDIQHDYYRPHSALGFDAALNEDGMISALELRASNGSILEWGRPGRLKGKVDPLSVSGLSDLLYEIPNLRVSWLPIESPIPVGVWRSVGHSQNGFFLESVIDELAWAANQDPLEFRMMHTKSHPRMQAVLSKLKQESGWGQPKKGNGRGLGVAIAEAYGSVCAYVVEVEVVEKALKIVNVTCVLDCGFAVSPDGVKAQVEGSVVFALSAAIYGKITIEGGAVMQSNYHDYQMVTLANTPPINVHILEGDWDIGGAGEPGLPPFAPALTNAIFAATGERHRTLPLVDFGYTLS